MTNTQIKARVGDMPVDATRRSVRRRSGIDWRVEDGQTQIFNVALPQALAVDYSTAHMMSVARTHEIVNACMRIRADGLIQPRLVVERRQRDGTYLPDDKHPLLSLFRAPTPTLDMATLWRCMSVSWDAAGVVYLEPVYQNGMLSELHPLDPTLMHEVPDGRGYVAGFEYNVQYGTSIHYALDELIIRRTVYWADPPPLYTALRAADADEHMTEYVRAFFANAGVPSGIIKVHGTIGRDAASELQQQWSDKYTIGGTHQGAPAVLDENADYQRVGAQLNELESAQIKSNVETRICMPFGVPPILIGAQVGLEHATYSNFEQALTAFWDGTMLPLLGEWSSWATRTLLAKFETPGDIAMGNVRVIFDKRGIGPYQDDTTALIEERRAGLAAGGVTINEYRAALGLDPRKDGDVFLIPSTATLADTLVPPEPEPIPAPLQPFVGPASEPAPADEEKRLRVAHNVKAKPKPSPRLDADVATYLKHEYAKARRLFLAGQTTQQITDELDAGLALFGILGPHERRAYAESWSSAARRIDWDVVIDSGDVTSAVDLLAERAVGITDTTKQEITDLILKGTTEQWTDAEIAEQIAGLSFTRSAARAPVITRTELAVASTTAARDAYAASGVVSELEWLTGPDPCPECQARDGTRYPLDKAPEVPAHPNCTCDVAPIVSEVLA